MGQKIRMEPDTGGRPPRPVVPDNPVIVFIEGDGIGPDIWAATVRVLDKTVLTAYSGKRKIAWLEALAGEKAKRLTDKWLPEATLEAIAEHCVAIKGPLTTPVGGGIRSLNVALRHRLELYACVRPVKHIAGVPSPVREPEKVDMVIFRENMEDVYAGIEWKEGSDEARRLITTLREDFQVIIPEDSGLGIKPISRRRTRNLIRRAIQYAVDRKRSSVTIVHKGNIMKFTEGAFRAWGYELAKEEFGEATISEELVQSKYGGETPKGMIVIKDQIADSMFQMALLRPQDYDVIATTNLNGDYLSDALAAIVGGLGMAPGANIGDGAAVFEATHGTAPKYAGLDKVNPSSLILSGALMLEHLGWIEAAELIPKAIQKAILKKEVTYDLARLIQGSKEVPCSVFADRVIENL